MLKLPSQQDEQVIQVHFPSLTWPQVVKFCSTCLEYFNAMNWQPQSAVTAIQIQLQKHCHKLLQYFSDDLGFFLPCTCLVINFCVMAFISEVAIPQSKVFVFSHVAFLLLVDGVATTTLAVGDVAFYSSGVMYEPA
ncbi:MULTISPECIES: hypothetical protein [unclassified Halomonas]|uniref:hypothetical protein n=1 Tax=unclassified Halomonas TaxID=2609666 RepID=UPI0007D905D8|nr:MULTISPECIES: hypothetical protein [unclassified Halomonas]MBT2788074.1 hypothetical protein [Halomonas sp. ISL-106]MBT2795823.1 hypothetical protein [Halomonas sp. ISL-104]OAL61108.1 hypothetical protein A6R74_16045 [Halomonas sp. ALS9]